MTWSDDIPNKTNRGHFFEDFTVGQILTHATPRTVTEGDVALYTALYGSRFAVQSSQALAQSIGLPGAPIDDWLAFHIVFGKTVPDISLNAVANLGYAQGRMLAPVYPGDTLTAASKVIGVRENSSRKSGIVYVHTIGRRQDGEAVIDYVRWVMVRKRDEASAAPESVTPHLAEAVKAADLVVPPVSLAGLDLELTGSPHLWDDYAVSEKIDHVDGVTIEEAEHMMATRLYQNTAKVHFNQFSEGSSHFGRRLIYGGHIISLARALTFNGLANALFIAGLNGGRHIAPCFAGDTIFAWSQVLEKAELPGREDAGALRLRTIAAKDRPCQDHPYKDYTGHFIEGVVLELDYWAIMPRKVG